MMLRSLRSRLILASLLWTTGLLMLMHLASMMLLHIFPMFHGSQAIFPVLAGLGFMATGIYGARRGLTPFRSLRERLAAVRQGHERRVEGTYPSEIQPVIDELNELLKDRERAV